VQEQYFHHLPVELDYPLPYPIIGDALSNMLKGHYQGIHLIMLVIVLALQDKITDKLPMLRVILVKACDG
jgi:hypothetical protein